MEECMLYGKEMFLHLHTSKYIKLVVAAMFSTRPVVWCETTVQSTGARECGAQKSFAHQQQSVNNRIASDVLLFLIALYLSLSSLLWRPIQLYLRGRGRGGGVSQKIRHCYSSLQLTYYIHFQNAQNTLFHFTVDIHFQNAHKTQKNCEGSHSVRLSCIGCNGIT